MSVSLGQSWGRALFGVQMLSRDFPSRLGEKGRGKGETERPRDRDKRTQRERDLRARRAPTPSEGVPARGAGNSRDEPR